MDFSRDTYGFKGFFNYQYCKYLLPIVGYLLKILILNVVEIVFVAMQMALN